MIYFSKTENLPHLLEVHQKDYNRALIDLAEASNADDGFILLKEVLSSPYSDKAGLSQIHSFEHCLEDWLYINWGRKVSVFITGWSNFTKQHPYTAQKIISVFPSALVRAALDVSLIHLEPEDKSEFGIDEVSIFDNIELIRVYFIL